MAHAAVEKKRSPARKIIQIVLWALAALIGLLVLATIGLALTFNSAKLVLPTVDVGPLPVASPPAGMSISSLPTGTYEGQAAMMFNGGTWSDVRQLAMDAVLVRHPKGNLLIDVGAGTNVDRHFKLLPAAQQFTTYAKQRPVVAQLAAAGLKPDDIAAVIPTHAHWDHVSGIEDMASVPVMQTAQGRQYLSGRPEGTEVINSFRNVNFKEYGFEGPAYLGFPRSHDVYGDGSVVIVPAPGHTPDSVMVFVNLPSGKRYAFIGDLVFQGEGLTLPAEKPWILRLLIGENNKVVHNDIALIRAATAKYPQLSAVPAHEARAFTTIPRFPAARN